MQSVKKALHIRSKSKAEPQPSTSEADARASIDSEVAAMNPAERDAYIKDLEEAEKTGAPKKGSFLDKLIERGNKKTEEQLAREAREREAKEGVIH
ncbi:hypothetical protein K505DRAFT_357092 [Melanomma pulvis-pyrius CBS 109.77]|uniref:Uncharacterized protein n=1 Tax=Melanomma pulvis-pyrius CBS 109.77 TaxID=1314802 RepID=A0A6A6XQU1_9PLEO|nr:hypothetical protein K505DRAFT_357092 [Melanomma pulvis-pyrius CBS 109.77]